MSGFLFEQIIFGPVKSRRLGISLGVNLLPTYKKHCTFNCVYCECGWTPPEEPSAHFPTRQEIQAALQDKLLGMQTKGSLLDSITFAGNGEPTIHPHFEGIIHDTIQLRDLYYPDSKISVLTNASRIALPGVSDALMRIDQPILKLDAGTEDTFVKLNKPRITTSLETLVDDMKLFRGKSIIQSLFVRGKHGEEIIDNTTDREIRQWLHYIEILQPRLVMIYPIARSTPVETLEVIPQEELMEIARRVQDMGIEAEVF